MLGAMVLFWVLPAVAKSMTPGEVTLAGTRSFTMHSPETGRDYLVQVSVPETMPPAEGFPVLYLLDGKAYLPLMQMARDTLSREGPGHTSSPLLIVGIDTPGEQRFNREQRAADFTPAGAQGGSASPQGQADRFLAFIQSRLKPAIHRRFPVDQARQALFGHSFGGLFATHVLLTAPESFQHYIAISPSLWWYGADPVAELEGRLSTPAGETAPGLLLGVGALEQTVADAVKGTPRTRLVRERAMVDNVVQLAAWLAERHPQWPLQWVIFPGEGHGSVMWPAARRTMEFLHGNLRNRVTESPAN